MKSRVDGNVSPEHVMQLMYNRKPVADCCELKRRRDRVASNVVVKSVRQRQIDVLHQPVDKRCRRAVGSSVPTKCRNGRGLGRAGGRARRHCRSPGFSVQ